MDTNREISDVCHKQLQCRRCCPSISTHTHIHLVYGAVQFIGDKKFRVLGTEMYQRTDSVVVVGGLLIRGSSGQWVIWGGRKRMSLSEAADCCFINHLLSFRSFREKKSLSRLVTVLLMCMYYYYPGEQFEYMTN